MRRRRQTFRQRARPATSARPAAPPPVPERFLARRQARRRRRRWLLVASVLVVLVSPALYSYVATMIRPSSLPLSVRSVEWVRDHRGNWLVDDVERVYYGWWKAPRKAGHS